jgi:hypothetical protein
MHRRELFRAALGIGASPQTRPGLQTSINLFGPEPRAYGTPEALECHPGTEYGWQGSALTASTRRVFFDQGLSSARLVVWRLVWMPRVERAAVRLIHMEDGPTNIVQLAEVVAEPGKLGPVVAPQRDVTAEFNALVRAGTPKHLGHQAKGNGDQGPIIFSSSLEVVWNL